MNSVFRRHSLSEMACKFAVFFAFIAVANAGYLNAPIYTSAVATPAVLSLQSNILRSHGNFDQLSTYLKTINSPHSTLYKSDFRLSNGALAYPYSHGYAAPTYGHPHTAHVYSHPYAAPVHSPTYAVPAVSHQYAAPTSLLGVAYSPATAAAHFSYSNGYGVHYSY